MATKNQAFNIDEEIFYKLISLEGALSESVTDPIKVRSNSHILHKRDTSSLVYFYLENHGEDFVRRRIRLAHDDIRIAIVLHEKMLHFFRNIKERINNNDRKAIEEGMGILSDDVSDYLDLVGLHQSKMDDDYFLYYPTFTDGYFITTTNYSRTLSFNSNQSNYGARIELVNILELSQLFLRCKHRIDTGPFKPSLENFMPSLDYEENLEQVRFQLKDVFNFTV